MENKKTIQDYLRGIDAEFDSTSPREIKMLRHADNQIQKKKGEEQGTISDGVPFPSNIPNLYAAYIYSRDVFIRYQKEQNKNDFKNIKYIISFIKMEGTTALFLGVYKIMKYSDSKYKANTIILDLKPIEAFSHLEEKLLIDWGRSAISWHQYYNNHKIVLRDDMEISKESELPSVESFKDVILPYPLLKEVVLYPQWVEKLKSCHCIYAIMDNKNGKLYVGSTYNYNGILGRWEVYAKTGHGYDKELMALVKKDESYAKDNFQWTILECLPINITPEEAIKRENVWKEKLGTRVHGYNEN